MDPTTPRFGSVEIRNRGRLPHWSADSATYFVTFRLADSLPQAAIGQLQRVALSKLTKLGESRRAFATLERYLDAGSGEVLLNREPLAQIVADALRYFHASRYRLIAWCIMPNHVHVCLKMLPGQQLCDLVQAWKSFSSKQINSALHRNGRVWMREYYDRLVRNQTELMRTIAYIERNPEKAALKNWRWVEILSDV